MASTFQIKSNPNPNPNQNPPCKIHKGFLITQVGVRTMGIAATLISLVTMVTSKQTTDVFGIVVDANYRYAFAFKFSAGVNGAACFLSLVSLSLFLYCVRLSNPGRNKYFTIFLLDLMVMVLVLIGSPAASAIAFLGKYGNDHTGWMPICDHFGKFCNRIMASLVSSYIAALLFTVLTAWSAWNSTKSTHSSMF